MMRILTILLLPLLFIATSCDSGGEGTACSIDASGQWRFEAFEIEFSDSCECDGACDEIGLQEAMMMHLKCANVQFVGDLVMNFCDSDADGNDLCDCSEENNCSRGQEDCKVTYAREECVDTVIGSLEAGVNVLFNGDQAVGSTNQQLIEDFLSDYLLWDEWGTQITGSGCTVATLSTLYRSDPVSSTPASGN